MKGLEAMIMLTDSAVESWFNLLYWRDLPNILEW